MTKALAPATIGIFALLLGLSHDQPTEEQKLIINAVNRQADQVGKKSWEQLSKDGKAVVEKLRRRAFLGVRELDTLYLPRHRSRSGLGVGDPPGPYGERRNGIEIVLLNLSRQPLNEALLKKHRKDFVRMAEVIAAISSMTAHLGPRRKVPGKDWVKDARLTYDGAVQLRKALDAGKPEAIQEAARKTQAACVRCHR